MLIKILLLNIYVLNDIDISLIRQDLQGFGGFDVSEDFEYGSLVSIAKTN